MEGLANYSDSEEEENDERSSGSESPTSKQSHTQGGDKDAEATKPVASSITMPTKSAAPKNQSESEPTKKRRILPSASALLSGSAGRPSFLSSAASNAPIFEIPDEEKTVAKVDHGEDEDEKKDSSTSTISGGASRQTAPVSAGSSKDKDKELQKKNDVKDKLKQARLKGQSAHARWKSEGEMLLRQQYD